MGSITKGPDNMKYLKMKLDNGYSMTDSSFKTDLGIPYFSNNNVDPAYLSLLLLLNSATNAPNVVAIDNKIEQAMDLVKSHLMYAVREEVEVLKEQIKELIERNQQLERENNLLKQNASSDVLEQLNTLQPPPSQNQPPTTTS